MILVTGGTGALGSCLVRRLLQDGEAVRVVSRDPGRAAALAAGGAEVVRGDLLENDWQAALAGVGTVVIASHGLYPPSRRNHPAAVDGRGARWLIDAAAAAGVGRLVYLSAAGAAADAAAFLRIKYETEKHLRATNMRALVIRPTVLIENNALLLLGEPLRHGQPVQLIGPGTTPMNWVSADAVAATIVDLLQAPDEGNRTLELRGPDTLSQLECLAVLEAALGREAKRQHLPRAVAWLVGRAAAPFNPGLACLLDFILAANAAPAQPMDAEAQVVGSSMAAMAARWAEAPVPA